MELRQSAVSKDSHLSCVCYVTLCDYLNHVLLSGSGALWLEVYHFPADAWLKELEMALSQKQVLY